MQDERCALPSRPGPWAKLRVEGCCRVRCSSQLPAGLREWVCAARAIGRFRRFCAARASPDERISARAGTGAGTSTVYKFKKIPKFDPSKVRPSTLFSRERAKPRGRGRKLRSSGPWLLSASSATDTSGIIRRRPSLPLPLRHHASRHVQHGPLCATAPPPAHSLLQRRAPG